MSPVSVVICASALVHEAPAIVGRETASALRNVAVA
jgi:hypothetical protein